VSSCCKRCHHGTPFIDVSAITHAPVGFGRHEKYRVKPLNPLI
jgi:hypothetical protein